MLSFRDYFDPGGRMLARRLEQLCSTLEYLGAELPDAIANAIGELIGGYVRDTAMRLLREATQYLPAAPRSISIQPTTGRWNSSRYEDDDQEDWYADEEESATAADTENHQPQISAPSRFPAALSAGLQAASWWLRRCRSGSMTTLAIGLVAAGLAFLGGPLVVAIFGLAESATRFASLAGAIDTTASTLGLFKS